MTIDQKSHQLFFGWWLFWFLVRIYGEVSHQRPTEIEKIPHKILLFAKQIQIGIKAKKLVSLLLGFEF